MVLDSGEFWEPEPFQLEVAADVFAGVPEVWMIVPEGNGKTTLMSALALYHGDYTDTAMVLMAAASRDQAGLLFSQAAGFVERSPGFGDRFKVFEGYRKIKCKRSAGVIQVFAADDRTGDGVIPTMAFLDELHRHRDMKLYRTWRGKLAKRNGQLITISTAGEPETEFEDTRERALKTATDVSVSGSHTRAASAEMVLHDHSVPADADVEDMAVVKAANPLRTITVESLQKKRASPAMTLAHWQRFVCNQAVRSTESAITVAEWNACRTDEQIPEGTPVWVGADFGWKWDTTAIAPLWMPELHKRLFGAPEILTPPRDGASMSPLVVQEAFGRIHERNPIHTVVMDEAAGGAQMAEWLEQQFGCRVISHSQTHSPMALAFERWMEAMREGWLFHTGDPEFARHVLNAVGRVLPGGQSRFDRPVRSRTGGKQDQRVWDALTAASMVHSVAVAEFSAPVPSVAFW